MRRIIKNEEVIILREYPDGGFVSVGMEILTKKMKDIHSEETLAEMEASGEVVAGFREMPFIAVIKSDIANKDRMGWKQHQQVLKEDGFDV